MLFRRKLILLVIILFLITVYGLFDPNEFPFYPRCIFLSLTGYRCPGCGAQRMFHYLLKGDILHAFECNALLLCALPYCLICFTIQNVRALNSKKWITKIYSPKILVILAIITVLFGISRN